MLTKNSLPWIWAGVWVLVWAGVAEAEVRLPPLISDHMVLQNNAAAPVYGTAAPGEKITVAFAGNAVAATADGQGHWIAKFPPLKPSTGAADMTITDGGGKATVVHDVLVGEVWLGSGQSNMFLAVKRVDHAEQEIAAAKYPAIRFFNVKQCAASERKTEYAGQWVLCAPETAVEFSATLYFLGRDLHQARHIPVGLIHSSWGATRIETWISRDSLAGDPELKTFDAQWKAGAAAYPKLASDYAAAMAEYPKQVADAKAKNEKAPRMPQPPLANAELTRPEDSPYMGVPGQGMVSQPGSLFNGQIAPLIPYGLAGVVWYQGESNHGAEQYRRLLPLLIQDWRKAWAQPELPFIIVQLPNNGIQDNLHARDPDLVGGWAEIREAQLQTVQATPHTALAVTIDIGGDLHPRDKQTLGHRLSLAAQSFTDKSVVATGPEYQAMKIEGHAIRLSFKSGGLRANPVTNAATTQPEFLKSSGKLFGFSLCGEDRKFVWADAVIEGETVVVSSKDIVSPVAVRYAWTNNPVCNFANAAGLPASPFRTDDFKPVKK